MVGELTYVRQNDSLKAADWNKVVNYCNGPGEYSNASQFTTTNKGTLYQSNTTILPKPAILRDLLRAQFQTWSLSDQLCSTIFLQLGPSYGKTLQEFKIAGQAIDFIAVCPLCSNIDKSYIVDDVTTSCWNAISGQGVINTFIPYEYSVVGQIVNVDMLSTYSPEPGSEQSADISSHNGRYGLIINDWYTNNDPEILSTMLSSLSSSIQTQLSDYGSVANIKMEYEFDIFSRTQYTFENDTQQSAWISAGGENPYVQCHIGGIDSYPIKNNPEPFDIEDNSIVRQYLMVGNKIFKSIEAISGDVEGGSTALSTFFDNDYGVIACKVADVVLSSGEYTQNVELTGYESLDALVADQNNPNYSVIPLYQFDLSANGRLLCDFRHGPRSQNFENLGW